MDTNAKKMACGGCGHRKYHLYWVEGKIAAQCLNCKDISYIQPKPAELSIEWGETSSGCLAIYDGVE